MGREHDTRAVKVGLGMRDRLSAPGWTSLNAVESFGAVVIARSNRPEGFAAFLMRKRRWVFDAVREIEAKHRALLTQRYASGAKVQYRGRWLMLDVVSGDVGEVSIVCRSKFHVVVPAGVVWA